MIKTLLTILLTSLSIWIWGQSLEFSSAIKLEDIAGFEPKLVDFITPDRLLVLGQQRKDGDLNAHIAIYDTQGVPEHQLSIGAANTADRCIDLFRDPSDQLWLLVNSFDTKSTLFLYQLDDQLQQKDRIEISIDQITSGIGIGKITERYIWLIASYTENTIKSYPVLIQYDRQQRSSQMTALDYNNPSEFTESMADYGVKDSDPEEKKTMVRDMIRQTKIQLFKNANAIIEIPNGFIIAGAENTNNMGDFWAISVGHDGNTIWEQLYEKDRDPGVDALINAISLDNGNVILSGTHYNKLDQLNYSYNSLVVHSSGKLIHEIKYDTGFDEYLDNSYLIHNQILLVGFLNKEPEKNWIGDNIENSNLYFVVTDINGQLIKEQQIENKLYDRMVTSAQIDLNTIGYIFKRSEDEENWTYYFQTIRIPNNKP